MRLDLGGKKSILTPDSIEVVVRRCGFENLSLGVCTVQKKKEEELSALQQKYGVSTKDAQ